MSSELSLFQQALAERLHDGPLQDLLSLQLRAANLSRLGAASVADRHARIAELEELAQAVIDQLQQVIRDLAGGAARSGALFVRLTRLCDEFRDGSGIECRFLVTPAHLRFEPLVSEVVFRAVREALANVQKHSHATVVKIGSRVREDGTVAISVSDNGIGLGAVTRRRNPFEGGGFGLWSIEHRLGELGGALELDHETGLGLTLVLPRRLLAGDLLDHT